MSNWTVVQLDIFTRDSEMAGGAASGRPGLTPLEITSAFPVGKRIFKKISRFSPGTDINLKVPVTGGSGDPLRQSFSEASRQG